MLTMQTCPGLPGVSVPDQGAGIIPWYSRNIAGIAEDDESSNRNWFRV